MITFHILSLRFVNVIFENFNYRDAIQMALEKRNILLDKVNVFVAQSKTPLPLQAECSFLGGSHVHVRGKMNTFSLISH